MMIQTAQFNMRTARAVFVCPMVAVKSVMSTGTIRDDRRVLRRTGHVAGYGRNNLGSGVT